MKSRAALKIWLFVVSIALSAQQTALARTDDCPPGSVFKSEDGFSFCEATVCATDTQCMPNICRPVRLCIQVGTLGDASGEGGKRLVATQRCAPDMTCPQSTVCSEMNRCVSKADAEKMGTLTPASSAAPTPTTDKKSSCGCRVVGASFAPSTSLALIGGVALLVLRRRRRR